MISGTWRSDGANARPASSDLRPTSSKPKPLLTKRNGTAHPKSSPPLIEAPVLASLPASTALQAFARQSSPSTPGKPTLKRPSTHLEDCSWPPSWLCVFSQSRRGVGRVCDVAGCAWVMRLVGWYGMHGRNNWRWEQSICTTAAAFDSRGNRNIGFVAPGSDAVGSREHLL